jgi:hypothetical protein
VQYVVRRPRPLGKPLYVGVQRVEPIRKIEGFRFQRHAAYRRRAPSRQVIAFERDDIEVGPRFDLYLDDMARRREQPIVLAFDRDMPRDRPFHACRKAFKERAKIALRLTVPGRAQIKLTGARGQTDPPLMPMSRRWFDYSICYILRENYPSSNRRGAEPPRPGS